MSVQIARIGGEATEPYAAEIVGGKAANLARMAALGLPVPPAFVLPISLCAAITSGDARAAQDLTAALAEGMQFLEQTTGRTFGDRRRPLLVSVRSGAARSMPGMLDTVLNIGCSLPAVQGLVRMTGHPRFAYDCRRRFLESYGTVVLGVDRARFAKAREALLATEQAGDETALDSDAIEHLAGAYERTIEDDGQSLSDDPVEHLTSAAQAVFRSWTGERARTYRRLQHLEDLRGTAVTVQAMVFGNAGGASGAGVAFSRDPSTGAAAPVIDVLFDSQGEDVVSGDHTPDNDEALARSLPEAAAALRAALLRLEDDFADVQDVEFTIENGRLWLLQTRSAKRTPRAALRLAIDFVNEGRITPAEALSRLDGVDLRGLANKRLIIAAPPIARGTCASSGIAVGRAAFDTETASAFAAATEPVILIRPDTTTADVAGFASAAGIVTAIGGRTAHAALVARQMGKPCIVGCAALSVEPAARKARLGATTIGEGDWLSIDGDAGAIYLGRGEVVSERPDAELAGVERWRALAPSFARSSHVTAAAAPPPRSDGSRLSSGSDRRADASAECSHAD